VTPPATPRLSRVQIKAPPNPKKQKNKKTKETENPTMKKSKLLTLILAAAVLLAFALPMTVSAANITINGGDAGNTYDAYKLLDLKTTLTCDDTHTHGTDCYGYAYTLRTDSGGIYKDLILDVLEIDPTGKTDAQVNSLAMAAIGGMNETAIRAFSNDVYAAILEANDDTPGTYTPDASSVNRAFNVLDQGYYLIVETTDDPLADGDAISLLILDTMGRDDITINAKKSVPSITKKVSDSERGTFGSDTTANIGDYVYFQITSAVPDMTGYSSYTFTVNDTMSAGLTFDGTNATTSGMVITVGPKTLTWGTDYTVQTTSVSPYTFKIVFDDFILYGHVHDEGCYDEEEPPELECELPVVGDAITITYKALLNEGASIGAATPANQNTAKLTYSNKPDSAGDPGTGNGPETPPVKVYTFDFEVIKVNGDDNNSPLADAVFNLFKADMVANDGTSTGSAINFMPGYRVAKSGESGSPALTSADVTGLINVKGLKAGLYVLKEITPPEGFNQLTYDIVIRITHTGAGAYTVDFQPSVGYDSGWTASNVVKINPSEYLIVNESGTLLPGAGGMGEKLIVIGGLAIIAVFAVAIVYYKKRRTLNAVKG